MLGRNSLEYILWNYLNKYPPLILRRSYPFPLTILNPITLLWYIMRTYILCSLSLIMTPVHAIHQTLLLFLLPPPWFSILFLFLSLTCGGMQFFDGKLMQKLTKQLSAKEALKPKATGKLSACHAACTVQLYRAVKNSRRRLHLY